MAHDSEWRKNAAERSLEISKVFDKSVFGDSVEAIYDSLLK